MSDSLERKPLIAPHELAPVGAPRGETEAVAIGPVTLARSEFRPGWRWSEDVKPLVNADSCQTTHTGVVLEGRLMVRMEDGSQMEYGPGDAFYIPSGHDKWVVGDERCILVDLGGVVPYGMTH